MNTLLAYLRWLWWWLAYAFVPQPNDFVKYIERGMRTRPPWWKFKPYAYHNDDGRQWEVRLENEQSYTETGSISAEIHRSQETGRIVGFTVWDETLKPPAAI